MAQLPTRPAESKKPAVIKKQELQVEDITEWNETAGTGFTNRVPAKVKRTVITVHRHEIIIERSGPFFKVLGKIEDLIFILSSGVIIGAAVAAIIFAATKLNLM